MAGFRAPNPSLNADVPHAGCARQRAAGWLVSLDRDGGVYSYGTDMQAGRESLVAAPVWAYPWVHRATRVALDLIEGRSVAGESSRGPRSNLRGASTCVKSEIQVHIKNLGLIFSFCSRGAL